MKKITFILASIFFAFFTVANAQTVRIYNKTDNQLSINYQACLRDIKNSKTDCFSTIYNISIKKHLNYLDIELPEYADCAKVIDAYEIDDQGKIQAKGEYPGEEDCKSWHSFPVSLYSKKGTEELLCERL